MAYHYAVTGRCEWSCGRTCRRVMDWFHCVYGDAKYCAQPVTQRAASLIIAVGSRFRYTVEVLGVCCRGNSDLFAQILLDEKPRISTVDAL